MSRGRYRAPVLIKGRQLESGYFDHEGSLPGLALHLAHANDPSG